MADKTFFGRLKKLFSTSTVVRQVGDKGLRVVDTGRLQSSGKLASNTLIDRYNSCLLYTSPSPRDRTRSRMPSSA